MLAELEGLEITTEELDNLVELDAIASIAVDVYRALTLKNSKRLISVLLTQLFIFIVILIVAMAASILVLRKAGHLPQNHVGAAIILGIALVGMLGWNLFLWKRAKQNRYLARLLEKVDEYNSTISAMILLVKLEGATKSTNPASNWPEVIEALSTTKESLIDGVKVGAMMRKYHGAIERYSQLFLNLENNLTTLMSLDVSHQTREYQDLLNNALQIGMSVHKEVRKIRDSSF